MHLLINGLCEAVAQQIKLECIFEGLIVGEASTNYIELYPSIILRWVESVKIWRRFQHSSTSSSQRLKM